MGSPSSSSLPLLPPPDPSNPPSLGLRSMPEPTGTPDSDSPPQKKPPPLPWTHQETLNLIQAYQEKWYSLNKGQLKSSQWEEVAITVAARCAYDEPSKTATQCRHKIEKLRKRYRAEKGKPYSNPWQYFELMDRMERGPFPITARPLFDHQKLNSAGNYNETDTDDEEVDYGTVDLKKKSINNILRGDLGLINNSNRSRSSFRIGNFGVSNQRGLRSLRTPVMKRKEYIGKNVSDEDEMDNVEDEEGNENEVVGGKELAAAIRGFAESFMRMENKKIEMTRATESYRMEMENKRMDMILESQRKIVDTIGKAVGAYKKVKLAQET